MVSLAFVAAPAGRALAWRWQGVWPYSMALLGVASGAWPLFRLVTASTLLRGSGRTGHWISLGSFWDNVGIILG